MSAPKFDRDGRHWEGHGDDVYSDRLNGTAEASFSIYTRRHETHYEGRGMVLLSVSAAPFSMSPHFTPANARALAANLLLAADHADLVQAAVDASAAKPKAVAL